jgi:hypothetical protein
MKSLLLALSLLFLTAIDRSFAAVEPDIVGPTVTVVNPAIGVLATTELVVVSGTAKDNKQAPTATTAATPNTVNLAGVRSVQYRYAGQKSWRKAIIIPGATAGTTTADPTWVFTFKLAKGANKRVSIRSTDNEGNIGDIITIRIKRSRASS